MRSCRLRENPSLPRTITMSKIAIHGFGRIGRSTLKAALQARLWTPVSISDIRDTATFAAVFEFDSESRSRMSTL